MARRNAWRDTLELANDVKGPNLVEVESLLRLGATPSRVSGREHRTCWPQLRATRPARGVVDVPRALQSFPTRELLLNSSVSSITTPSSSL